jgi:SagB-type dehydrogenase family enzyme
MNNRNLAKVWAYHDGTKHSFWSIRHNTHFLDWPNKPLSFKIYSTLEPISLQRKVRPLEMPALEAISATSIEAEGDAVPELNDLAQVLYYSAGITKIKKYPGGEIFFRAASCTGALYEIELYLVCGDLPNLEAGVYHFSPHDLSLRCLRKGDFCGVMASATGREESVISAPVTIICTGTYWRNSWKYQARTYRHFGWDNGTILANLLAASMALGLPSRVVMGFVDDEVNRLLGLNIDHEVAFSLVSLGRISTPPPAPPTEIEKLVLETEPLSVIEIDYPAMNEMHAASSLVDEAEVSEWRGKTPVQKLPNPSRELVPLKPFREDEFPREELGRVILQRGSSRQFARGESISLRQFSTLLYHSMQGIPADFLDPLGAHLNELYLIVHAVEGLQPGAYVLHRDVWALELLKPGEFRNEARYLGLEQELPGDASATVFFIADLRSALERFGNRGYRAAQLEAGILGGKMYLAAYAQGFGATGLTFYDEDVIKFFSPYAESKSAIFHMAIGKSTAYRLPPAMVLPES